MSQISLLEIAKAIADERGERAARENLELLRELAITFVPASDEQWISAGLLRSQLNLSTADAIIAAQAMAINAELVHKAQQLLGVKIHPVETGMPGLVAAAVAQQVKQHDPVALGGQGPGQAAAQVGVEQQAVQPDQHAVTRAVHLVAEPVLTEGKRVRAALGLWPAASPVDQREHALRQRA